MRRAPEEIFGLEGRRGRGTDSGDHRVRRRSVVWVQSRGNDALIRSARRGVGRGRKSRSESKEESWASRGVALRMRFTDERSIGRSK